MGPWNQGLSEQFHFREELFTLRKLPLLCELEWPMRRFDSLHVRRGLFCWRAAWPGRVARPSQSAADRQHGFESGFAWFFQVYEFSSQRVLGPRSSCGLETQSDSL